VIAHNRNGIARDQNIGLLDRENSLMLYGRMKNPRDPSTRSRLQAPSGSLRMTADYSMYKDLRRLTVEVSMLDAVLSSDHPITRSTDHPIS
jgi:hypothetical protein